ncbi:MAG: MarR family transcriptional regulator [Oscillospiraceae bacterium]|nr:MarR family transcriptional regulator [Oscillospiraceae bacterium]
MLSRFEQFSFAISSIYRYIRKIERDEMVKRGFRGVFAQYLTALNKFEEGLTATQLCSVCDKDKAAVSRIVAEMEEKGLVMRENKNKYRSRIVLTDEGKDLANFIAERAGIAMEAVSGEIMSEKESELFCSTLEEVCKNLQKVSREGIPQE